MASSTPSVNEPTRASFYHTVKLKPMIKAQISERMVSSGINDVAFISVYSENTRLKKCLSMIILLLVTDKPFNSKWKKVM